MVDPAPQVCVNANGLPDDVARRLFDAWVSKLSEQQLGYSQRSSNSDEDGAFSAFGDLLGEHFELRGAGLTVSVKVVDVDEEVVLELLDEASNLVAARDTGESVVYQLEITVAGLDFVTDGMHFMRMLGDQRHIEGSRRLADVVLMDFEQGLLADAPPAGLLLAPQCRVQVTVFAQGPGPSDWSQDTANAMIEVTAAICAFATGRSVDYFPMVFPAQPPDADLARQRQRDPTIPGLARDSISLDVFGELPMLGHEDAVLRVRGALLAYHAALKQTSPDVAVMLFVTAIEALISPRHEWGKQKVTARFARSLLELCPETVDALLAHGNIEEAFQYTKRGGINRQRQDLLNRIYDARSAPNHTGLGLSATGMAIMATPHSMRVALVSDLARAAILSYIQSPRSSLIGHPHLNPPAQTDNPPPTQ